MMGSGEHMDGEVALRVVRNVAGAHSGDGPIHGAEDVVQPPTAAGNGVRRDASNSTAAHEVRTGATEASERQSSWRRNGGGDSRRAGRNGRKEPERGGGAAQMYMQKMQSVSENFETVGKAMMVMAETMNVEIMSELERTIIFTLPADTQRYNCFIEVRILRWEKKTCG